MIISYSVSTICGGTIIEEIITKKLVRKFLNLYN